MSAIMDFQKNMIKQFVDMGYDENVLRQVLPQANWNYETAIDVLANYEWDSAQSKIIAEHQSQNVIKRERINADPPSQLSFLNSFDEQTQIAQAMNASLFNQQDQPVEKRKKIKQVPIGLQNYGNTCYLSCLLQIFFYNPVLVKLILQYKAPQINDERGKFLIKFIEEIQKCFVRLILRNENYIKTKDIFEAISKIDQNPQQLKRGDFKDANEYLEFILEFINRGLQQEFNKQIIQGFSNKILDQQYQIKGENQSHLQIFTRPQLKNINQILYQYKQEFDNDKFKQLPDNLIINVVRNNEYKDKNSEEIDLKKEICLDILLEENKENSQLRKSKIVANLTQEQKLLEKQYYALKKTIQYFENQPICQDNVIVSLKTQFEQIQQQLKEQNIEDQSVLQNSKYKYYLAQIIIHIGSVASGHYYVYQYNFQLQNWIKYNDTMVVLKNDDDVMEDVAKNCNVIIYISEEQKNKVKQYQAQILAIEEQQDLKGQITFDKNSNNIELLNYIPQQIGKQVLDENQAFMREYQRVVK